MNEQEMRKEFHTISQLSLAHTLTRLWGDYNTAYREATPVFAVIEGTNEDLVYGIDRIERDPDGQVLIYLVTPELQAFDPATRPYVGGRTIGKTETARQMIESLTNEDINRWLMFERKDPYLRIELELRAGTIRPFVLWVTDEIEVRNVQYLRYDAAMMEFSQMLINPEMWIEDFDKLGAEGKL